MSLVHYPFAYENNPEMDGVASAGTSLLWSRGDHRHPTDTTIYKSFPVNTISNTEVASFADGANSIPVQEFIMDITSVQDGTPAPNGPNIYDASTNTEGYYIADDGSIVVGANSFYSGYYAVNANQRYNLSATITFTSLNRVRIHGYDASKNWVNELYTGAVEAGTQTFQAVMIIPANVSFVRFSFNKNNTNTVFCEYNERPISGYTSAFIRGTGKNLFNSDGLLNASGWVKNSDGSYSGANDQLSRSRFDVVENCFPGLLTNRLGVDFTFSGTVTASSSLYIIFDIINAETGAIRQVARINITDTSFVLSTNCAENEYVSSMWFSYGTHHDITLSNIQLEFGRTATAYSAYVGRAYTVSWQSEAGTVYGGTLTWINGDTWTLTINKMLKLVESSDSNTFNNGVATVPNFFDGLSISNPICSHFVYEAGTSSDNTFYGVSTNRNLQIRSSAFSSKAEFNSFLESNTVQILTGFPSSVTPPSYTLTATDSEISTLFGINNLCTNCGNINTLTYHADPTLYANGIITPFKASIAPTEDGDVASQSYSQGEYFFRGTSFCKALTSIASGASFTLNTNYITTTVAAELFAAQNT